ncbi:hypothetical protein LCGC14_0373590 [marine sediment metagenome]|uniref:YqaJ viral recombinase domain-containing protein n=1 Tax=marine sediment metagenome TaxID=412755 RepID=A0A0F9TAF0_9ZZZZ
MTVKLTKYDFSLLTLPPSGESNTQEWLDARRGRITASKRAHMILNSRRKTLNAMMDEMAEELHHPAADGFSGKFTEHGNAFEAQSIGEYNMGRLTSGKLDRSPGMIVHPDFDIASATPDFLEGEDTTGQAKNPFHLNNHLKLLHWGVRKTNLGYYTQIQFESFVTQRPKIVFISYHPDAKATNQLSIELLDRDEAMHERFCEKLTEITWMLVNHCRYNVKSKPVGADAIPGLF